MQTALITLSVEGTRLLAPLVLRLPEARLFVHESVKLYPPGKEAEPQEAATLCPGLRRAGSLDPEGHDPTVSDAVPPRGNNAIAPEQPTPSSGHPVPSFASPVPERFSKIADLTAQLFPVCRNLVYAVPCGVVVRAITPLVASKYNDPAVVVLDVGGRWVISLLSGHEGGANALAIRVANLTGAEPVVTTTTEAVKSVIVGIGCRRGTTADKIVASVCDALAEAGVSLEEVRLLASAEVKADEPGLLAAAETLGVPIRFLPAEEIRSSLRDFSRSAFVEERVGLPAVAEPAALLAGRRTRFILRKKAYNGITIALAREGFPRSVSVLEED